MKENQNIENNDEMINEEYGQKQVKRASIGIVSIILVAFFAIMYCTGLIGENFGKTGENISLGLIGLVLVYYLYKTNKEK